MKISWAANGADISGSVSELGVVASQIQAVAEGRVPEAEAAAQSEGSATPYERLLGRMQIIAGSGPVCVSEQPIGVLNIKGGPRELDALASFFVFEPSEAAGAHSHYEYFEGNEYIASESLPLVVSIEKDAK